MCIALRWHWWQTLWTPHFKSFTILVHKLLTRSTCCVNERWRVWQCWGTRSLVTAWSTLWPMYLTISHNWLHKLCEETCFGVTVLCATYDAPSQVLLSIYCWHNLPRDLTGLADLCISKKCWAVVYVYFFFSLLCAWNKIPYKAKACILCLEFTCKLHL